MANNTDDFPDLLSAALSESGISDDTSDVGGLIGGHVEGSHKIQQTSATQARVAISNVPKAGTAFRIIPQTCNIQHLSTNGPPRAVLAPGLLTQSGALATSRVSSPHALGNIIRVTNSTSNIATLNNGKKIIIRTVRPQSSGATPTSGNVRVLQSGAQQIVRVPSPMVTLSGAPSVGSPSVSHGQLGLAKPGNIKIIRIKGGQSPGSPIRLPLSNLRKPVKIVTVKPSGIHASPAIGITSGQMSAMKTVKVEAVKTMSIPSTLSGQVLSVQSKPAAVPNSPGQTYTLVPASSCTVLSSVNTVSKAAVQASSSAQVTISSAIIAQGQRQGSQNLISVGIPQTQSSSLTTSSPSRILSRPVTATAADVVRVLPTSSSSIHTGSTSADSSPSKVILLKTMLPKLTCTKTVTSNVSPSVNTTETKCATPEPIVISSRSPSAEVTNVNSVVESNFLDIPDLDILQAGCLPKAGIKDSLFKQSYVSESAIQDVSQSMSETTTEPLDSLLQSNTVPQTGTASPPNNVAKSEAGEGIDILTKSEDAVIEKSLLIEEKDQDTSNNFNLFEDDGTDVDFFAQALQQLQDTNKKAAEFEAHNKSVTPKVNEKSSSQSPAQTIPLTISAATNSASSTTPTTSTAITVVQPSQVSGTKVSALPGHIQILRQGNSSPLSIRTGSPPPARSGSPITIIRQTNSPLNSGSPVSSPQIIKVVNPNTFQLAARGISPQGSTLTQLGQLAASTGRSGSPVMFSSGIIGNRRIIPAGSRITVNPNLLPLTATKSITGRSSPVFTVTQAGNGMVKTQLSEKDVSRMWGTGDLNFKKISSMPNLQQNLSPVIRHQAMPSPVSMVDEEVVEDEEDLGHAETYADYMPAKLKIGIKHPDEVVETSSMSSVEPQPVWYKLAIPEEAIDYGQLSALQLESIVYASQKHDTFLPSGERAGFLIGDGAGVGKGRTVAGLIYENYLQGRKRSLWLSVSSDLRVDAERDLHDIGAGKIEVHPLNKFKYAKISSHVNGSVKKGTIFATYSSLIGESQSSTKYRTRLKQLLHWLGKDFDGVIVFDECHRAKNLCPVGSSKPTKTGLTVLELQNRLPKSRIIYASATGASEPRNMAYMVRLGLWGLGTPFREFNDFISAVEKRGVGAMELVAMDMKMRGIYIARQLSFKGVSFKVDEIPIPKEFCHIYNESVKLWVTAREYFQRASDLIDAEHRMKKSMWGQFWSSHQRFFKYLCISAKVPHCVNLAREAVKNGKCVVIGLQSTGEARTLEQLEEAGGELNDFVSTAKGVFQTLVEKHFPAPDRRKTNSLFGLGSGLFDESSSSPASNPLKRRKESGKNNSKKARVDWYAGSESSSDSDSDSKKSMSPKAKSSSSESEMDFSESSDSPSGEDEFNPFGGGSDSDDDPWLNKQKPLKKKKTNKADKEKKNKTKKEKKKKKKKEKKIKKPKKESDDEFEDIDSKFDSFLKTARDNAGKENITSTNTSTAMPGMDAIDLAVSMKGELLERIEQVGQQLPPNTLDELIDQLGGPENVAEMTGRKGRVVSCEDGSVQYESRSEADAPLEMLNLTEKQRFMDGEKLVAIISEAASSGISLQADRRALNQRRRVHITLELPWSADRAVQQFGRTHRSNQVSAPEYTFLISELAGERRFASTVAKRLESLGALTHGDRRATETRDLSRFNIDNRFGRAALESVMKAVMKYETPLVPPPTDWVGNFFEDVKKGFIGVGMITGDDKMGVCVLEKDYNNISKFLNRILGMTVDLQNHLFSYFTETMATVILQAKRNGRWDMGILDLGSHGENVKTLNKKTFSGNFSGCKTQITLHSVSVERGLSWQKALDQWRDHDGSEDGFYVSLQSCNGHQPPVLAVAMIGKREKKERLYRIYRPNTGAQGRPESLQELKKKYKKVFPDDCRYHWEDQYDSSETICTHAYWRGSCRRAMGGLVCETGLRCRLYHVLSGSVLSVWNKVESVLASTPGGLISRMQIIRLRNEDGKRIVGTLIPPAAVGRLEVVLAQEATRTSDQQQQLQFAESSIQPTPVTSHFSSPALIRMANSLPTMPSNTSPPSQMVPPSQMAPSSRMAPPSQMTSQQYLDMPTWL